MELNLNTTSKAKLLELITSLEAEKTQLNLAATNALNIANYFGTKLSIIENLLTPLTKKGLGKTIVFIISNWKEIRTILESIVAQLKEWREQVEQLQKETPKEQ